MALLRDHPKMTINQLEKETGLSGRGVEWKLDE